MPLKTSPLKISVPVRSTCGLDGRRAFAALLIAAAFVRPDGSVRAEGEIVFTEMREVSGVGFVHTDGSSGRRYIVESVAGGLALFDYDGDGDVDLYFLNGAPLAGAPEEPRPTNALYRNDGGWKFTDVTLAAGVGDPGYGLGAAAGDYDNDGDPDLYISNFGLNVLYRNEGAGTFTDVTEEAGVAGGPTVGAGACFFDMDLDGDLDLYIANYLDFSYETHVVGTSHGVERYASPARFDAVADVLYRNEGDGTFTDVSAESGVAAHAGWGMGTICLDYDEDGDSDVFVANDISANYLFQNDGRGRFEEVGLLSGFAYDAFGNAQGSMGLDAGDYDGDGRLDLYVTSYQNQLATLYRNVDGIFFEDVTRVTGAGIGTYEDVTWGTGFLDVENDGDVDIFVAAGHLLDNIDRFDDSSELLQRNTLFLNQGDGTFVDVSERSGPGLLEKVSTRAAGFDDLDGDGDVDVVLLNWRDRPSLLRNDTVGGNQWLQVDLEGTRCNRSAVGARVLVVAGDRVWVQEVHSGRGYQSHYGTRLSFGLGSDARVDRVEVRWPGGGRDVIEDVELDRVLEVREGTHPAP